MKWQVLLSLITGLYCPFLWADLQYGADTYYRGNYWSPYPPGCVTVPLRQVDLYGDNVAHFYHGTMQLDVAQYALGSDPQKLIRPVNMNLYRIACAEANRSVILVEFSLPTELPDPVYRVFELPDFLGGTGFHYVPFILKSEPNLSGLGLSQQALIRRTFGDYTGGWDDASRFSWRYILDVGPAGQYWPGLTDYYNDSFGLEVKLRGGYGFVLTVPSTAESLTANTQIPLNGRLSGNWVEPETRDQGFLLSFSTLIPPATPADQPPEDADLLLFLSWYTFDQQGQMLWLTGSARIHQGDSEATIDFVRVEDGEFMGNREAARAMAGSAQLRAKNCNSLEFDYDLSSLGLGQGSMQLQRIFALEIAGYNCRDHEARLASISTAEGK
jgi:hypothetical protein